MRSATLSMTDSGTLRLPVTVRERYLSPDAKERDAVVQAAGTKLHIWIESNRATLRVDLPFDGFRAGKPYTRSLYRWGINVSRWLEPSEKRVGIVAEGDGEPVIDAEITTVDEEVCVDV